MRAQVAPLLLLLAACASAAQPSPYWGAAGELWQPDGPLPDFSFAGYRWGDTPLPSPPATKSLRDFQGGGATDGAAIAALVAWANAQPEAAGWVVLELPEGNFTLDRAITLTRSQTILRGAGRDRTELYLPSSLADLQVNGTRTGMGPDKQYFIFGGALITVQGPAPQNRRLAVVTDTPVERGSYTLQVDSTEGLQVNQTVTLYMAPGNGTLANEIMDWKLDPGTKYNNIPGTFASRVAALDAQTRTVALERPLPWNLFDDMEPALVERVGGLHDVGVEGFTMRFRHTPYLGHHKELGMSGVEFELVEDCWLAGMRFVNADNAVLVDNSDRVTVRDIEVTVTAPRLSPPEGPTKSQFDGHWGVRVGNSRDVLVQEYAEDSHMVHSLGADAKGAFSVFERARMRAGTLEMHRAQATQCLFTDIDVGDPLHSFYNGGPASSGPNTGAWTVYWNVRSDRGSHPVPDHSGKNTPGDCTFGPSLSFIGVKFDGPICPEWVHQEEAATPPNLYLAQLARRQGRPANGAAAAQRR